MGEDVPPGIGLRTRLDGDQLEVELLFDVESWEPRLAKEPAEILIARGSSGVPETLVWERLEPGRFRARRTLESGSFYRGAVAVGATRLPLAPWPRRWVSSGATTRTVSASSALCPRQVAGWSARISRMLGRRLHLAASSISALTCSRRSCSCFWPTALWRVPGGGCRRSTWVSVRRVRLRWRCARPLPSQLIPSQSSNRFTLARRAGADSTMPNAAVDIFHGLHCGPLVDRISPLNG